MGGLTLSERGKVRIIVVGRKRARNFLEAILRGRPESMPDIWPDNLPEDTSLSKMWYDHYTGDLAMEVASEEFDPVPEGDCTPVLRKEFIPKPLDI